MTRLALFFLVIFVFNAFAQSTRPVPGHPVAEPPIDVTSTEIEARMEYFDLVVVVNKASSTQAIQVYKKVDGKPQEILDSRVSTGTEEYTCHYPVDKITGHVSSRAIYTQTPAGYYTVANVDIDHFSGAFDDAHMPFAVFMYDPTGAATGVATHVAPSGTEGLIGHRASHGCMRLRAEDAKRVFAEVLATGGPVDFNSNGLSAQCNPATSDPNDNGSYCLREGDTRSRAGYYSKWLRANVAPDPSLTVPSIPLLDRAGNYQKDENGQIKMRNGYKTLYIIESVESGPSVASKVYRGGSSYRAAQLRPVACQSEESLNGGWNNGNGGYSWDSREFRDYRQEWNRQQPPPPPFGGGFFAPFGR